MTAWVLLLLLGAPVRPTVAVQVQGIPPAKCEFKARLSRVLAGLGLPLAPQAELQVTAIFGRTQTVLRIERHGTRVLERKLVELGCLEVVETSALIIDRFVTDVGWSGSTSMTPEAHPAPTPEIPVAKVNPPPPAAAPPPDAGPLPRDAGPLPPDAGSSKSADAGSTVTADAGVEAAEPKAAPAPVAEPPPVPDAGAVAPPPAPPPLAFDVDLMAGGALTNAGLAPTFGLALALHRGLWRAGLLAEAPLLPTQDVIIQSRKLGSIAPWQAHVLLAGGAQIHPWRLRLSGQVAAGALLTGVIPSGTFNRRQSGVAALAELGAVLRAVVRLAFGLEAGLLVKALFPLGSNAFAVEGTTASFRTSPFSVSLGVEIGWSSEWVPQ